MVGRRYWQHVNGYGTWRIVPGDSGYCVMWNEEVLGSHPFPVSALELLLAGQVTPPSSGIDPRLCALPDDFGRWTESVGRPLGPARGAAQQGTGPGGEEAAA